MNEDFDLAGVYGLGALIVGVLSFILIWFYALSEWGFLLGLVFGWIPALIGGYLFGFIWPLLLIIGCILLIIYNFSTVVILVVFLAFLRFVWKIF